MHAQAKREMHLVEERCAHSMFNDVERFRHLCCIISEQPVGEGGAMLQVDPWGKAAECERAMEIVADPERRVVLSSLRSVWVALGTALSGAAGFAPRQVRRSDIRRADHVTIVIKHEKANGR